MDTPQRISLAVAGCLLLMGCESLSSKDYSVMHEAFRNETVQAQLTASNLHKQVKGLQEQLGASRSAQARLQGELRDAERRLSEAERSVDLKQQELVKANAERDQLMHAGPQPRVQLSENEPPARHMQDTGQEQERINVLQLSIKKLTGEVASLNSIVRGLKRSAVRSSSPKPDRASHRLRQHRSAPVPAAHTPLAPLTPMREEEGAILPPFPAGRPVPGEEVSMLPSVVSPTLPASAAPMPFVAETRPVPRPAAASSSPALGTPDGGDQSAALKTVLMSIRPSEGTALQGLETRVDILAANAVGLMESTITLRYDPKVLEFRRGFESEFFNSEGPATIVVDSNPVAGTVTLRLKRAGGSKGVSGDGVLATVAFAGKTVGVSPLVIQSARLLNETKAVLPASGWPAVMRVQ